MALQTAAGCAGDSAQDVAIARLESLVASCLSHERRVNVLGFVDELLDLLPNLKSVRAAFEEPETLTFECADGRLLRSQIVSARPKLRMLCARLGVIAGERAGKEVMLYGDRVEFHHDCGSGRRLIVTLDFQNKPGAEGFHLTGLSAS